MTPLAWSLLALVACVPAGMLGRVAARAIVRVLEGAADPVRPLGWDAAMAEVERAELPELPLDRYSTRALREERVALAAELSRWAAWYRDEPRDTEAATKIKALERRVRECDDELQRRLIAEERQEQERIESLPPGPRDDVIEMRTFGDADSRRHVVRCQCDECKVARLARIPTFPARGDGRRNELAREREWPPDPGESTRW